MPLVPAKCTNCGAVLKVDDSNEQCFCEYCRTTFFVEKAINNYSINSGEVNISNSEVHIHSGLSTDDKINNAMNLLEVHKDYVKAEELFRIATKESPDNYLSWLGVFRAKTKDCTSVVCTDPELQTLLDSAVKVVDQEHRADVLAACDEYKKMYSLHEESASIVQKIGVENKKKGDAFIGLIVSALFVAILDFVFIYAADIPSGAVILSILTVGIIIAAIAVKVNQSNSTKSLIRQNDEICNQFNQTGKKVVKLMSPNKN